MTDKILIWECRWPTWPVTTYGHEDAGDLSYIKYERNEDGSVKMTIEVNFKAYDEPYHLHQVDLRAHPMPPETVVIVKRQMVLGITEPKG